MTSPEEKLRIEKLRIWAEESGLSPPQSTVDQHDFSDSSPDSSPASSSIERKRLERWNIGTFEQGAGSIGTELPPSSWEQGALEHSLDNFGVAKCVRCGRRMPKDPEVMDQQCAQCQGNQVDVRNVRSITWAPESGFEPILSLSSTVDEHDLSDSSPDSSPTDKKKWRGFSSFENGALEHSLDNLGVAKCVRCGIRLANEPEVLEQHSAQCQGNRVFTTTYIVGQDSRELLPKSPRNGLEDCSGPVQDIKDFLAGTPAALDGKLPPLFNGRPMSTRRVTA